MAYVAAALKHKGRLILFLSVSVHECLPIAIDTRPGGSSIYAIAKAQGNLDAM